MTASDVYMIRQFWTDKAGVEHSHYKTALDFSFFASQEAAEAKAQRVMGPNTKWEIVRLVPSCSPAA